MRAGDAFMCKMFANNQEHEQTYIYNKKYVNKIMHTCWIDAKEKEKT